MDCKGRYTGNILVERLWRSVKYEEVSYSGGGEAKADLDTYFRFYNTRRPHQSLSNRAPGEVFNGDLVEEMAQTGERRWFPDTELAPHPGATGPLLNPALMLSN